MTGPAGHSFFSSTAPGSPTPPGMKSLSSDDPLAANPPGQPRKIAPKKQALPSFGDGTVLQLPANSYTVVVARLA